MAIVVLSKNYASSSFCLKELSTIVCSIKDKGRCVLPVFYKVDPSDIRNLKSSYGEAMAQHEERSNSNMDLLQKWKNALNQVANLSGFDYEGNKYWMEGVLEQKKGVWSKFGTKIRRYRDKNMSPTSQKLGTARATLRCPFAAFLQAQVTLF